MANNTPDKMIQILSPLTGMTFKIELNGDEKGLRELLGTLLEIPSSSIRGIKDTYNNYYTLSSALKSKHINTSPNNYYSIVTENVINNNNYIRKFLLNPINNNFNNNKDFYGNNLFYYSNNYINDNSFLFGNNRINSIHNIHNIHNIDFPKLRNNFINNDYYNNYSIKDYYSLINFLFKNNYINYKNYFKLKKCIEINNQDIIEIMKPYIELDDNYGKLINDLFPILNLDLSINNELPINSKPQIQSNAYRQILSSIKEYFTNENMKELNYLLLMENIEIIKIFQFYYKTRNKKNLIKSLFNLLQKIPNININKNNRSKSKSNNRINKVSKERKSKSQNYLRKTKKSNSYLNYEEDHKNKKDKKENKEILNKYTDKIINYGKQLRKDIYYLMKHDLKSISDEDKKNLFSSKFKIDINDDNPELNSTNKKHIKNHYNKYIQTNIYKFLNEEEKKIYENIIEETNSQEYEELLEIYNDLLKNSKSKNKMELLRNKIINYIKQLIEQNEEEMNEEEKQESKESKSNDDNESSEKDEEEDNIIKIEANEEEEEDDDKNENSKKEKESSLVSSTVMVVDEEEEEEPNFEGSEESGVSIRKADRPRKN